MFGMYLYVIKKVSFFIVFYFVNVSYLVIVKFKNKLEMEIKGIL